MVLQAVKNGDFAADVLQFPDAMGIIGVDLMVRHLNGEEVPERVDSGSGSGHGGERRPVSGIARRSRASVFARLVHWERSFGVALGRWLVPRHEGSLQSSWQFASSRIRVGDDQDAATFQRFDDV